jgi:uncharacterized repeat protein (TIGR01451 family)
MSSFAFNRRRGLCGLFFVVLVAVGIVGGGASVAYAGASPVSISMTSSPNPVPSGSQLTHTITIANTGGSKVSNVAVTDQVPEMTGLILQATAGTCSQSANLVTCNVGDMAGGASATFTIRGIVTASSGTTLQNTATVTGTKSAQSFTQSTTTSTLVSGGSASLPDLTVSVAAPATVAPGAPIAYTLTVNNTGNANATGITVVNNLPVGATFVSVVVPNQATSLFTCGTSGLVTTCTGGRVNFGANATITINATAPSATGTIDDTAVVDPNNTIEESNELNNTGSAQTVDGTQPPPGTLTIVKTQSTSPAIQTNVARPGDLLHYHLVVTNTASSRADDVVVTDGTQGLDAASVSATISDASSPKAFCTIVAPKVTCTAPSPGMRLAAGQSLTVDITGTVVATAGSTIFNTATVTGNILNTGLTATDSAITTIKPQYDLTITKASITDPTAADPSTIRAADRFEYVFVVGNSGINDATGVVVRDPFPAGVLPPKPGGYSFGGTTGNFVCSVDASNVMTCTGTVHAESTETIIAHVVAPETTGDITNVATVDPNNAIPESDESNNTATITTHVATGVDLTISKTDDAPGSPPFVATAGNLTYTIVVTNQGTQDTKGVVVRDVLPQGVVFRSAAASPPLDHNVSCSNSGQEVDCINGILNGTYTQSPGGSDSFTIKILVFAPPIPGTIENVAKVDPDNAIPEINEDNNTAKDDTTVDIGGSAHHAFNQLTITKTQNFDPVATNGVETYTITIGNDGSDTAFHVAMRDFLPAGSRFIRADNGAGPGQDGGFQCTAASGVVDCTGGTVQPTPPAAAGTPKVITVEIFAPNTPGAYPNRALVDPDNTIPEGNETDNTATVVTNVAVGSTNGAFNELHIQNTSGVDGTMDETPDPVATSGTLTYTMNVVNTGSDPAFGVELRDVLPAGTIFRSATDITPGAPANTQFLCTASGGVVSCTGATIDGSSGLLGIGQSRTVKIVVFAPTQPGTITNLAQVDPNNTIPEADETNNSASATTVVQVAGGGPFVELNITDTSATPNPQQITDSPDPVVPGGLITYSFEVHNTGSDIAFNVLARDVLPVGTTFVSATSTGGFLCGSSNGVVDCTGGALVGGGVATITIVAKAPNASGVTLIDQAFVDPNNTIPEADETNNFASTTTTVTSPIDLTIKQSGPDSATQSSEADYTLTATDNCTVGGTVTAADCVAPNVAIHDPLPVGLIVLNVTSSDPQFACQVQQNPVNVVDCLGTLDSTKNSVTITIHVFMTLASGSYTNVACVDPNNTIVESDETNNCSTKTTVVAVPDLAIKATAVSDPVTIGQSEEFDLHVSNIGTADSTGDSVLDVLDPGVDFVNATATNGWTCTGVASLVTCTGDLSAGSSTDIAIQTKVNSSATNPITNFASVAADPAETNLGNNVDSVTVSLGASAIDLVANTALDTPDPVAPGGVVTYTSNVINTGSADATGVDVQQTVPSDANFVGASATNGFTCVFSAPNVDCTGNLNAGADVTVTIKVQTTASTSSPMTSTLTVDPSNTIAESNELNNTKTVTTSISGATCSSCKDLVISDILSTPADPSTIKPGDTLTYSFAVGNQGDQTTSSTDTVTITDTLDSNVTFVSASATDGFTCSNVTTTVTCTKTAGMIPGEGTIVTVVVTVNSPLSDGTVLNNSAKVDPVTGEFSTANNGPVTTSITVKN